jgi:hypothetical protein
LANANSLLEKPTPTKNESQILSIATTTTTDDINSKQLTNDQQAGLLKISVMTISNQEVTVGISKYPVIL